MVLFLFSVFLPTTFYFLPLIPSCLPLPVWQNSSRSFVLNLKSSEFHPWTAVTGSTHKQLWLTMTPWVGPNQILWLSHYLRKFCLYLLLQVPVNTWAKHIWDKLSLLDSLAFEAGDPELASRGPASLLLWSRLFGLEWVLRFLPTNEACCYELVIQSALSIQHKCFPSVITVKSDHCEGNKISDPRKECFTHT